MKDSLQEINKFSINISINFSFNFTGTVHIKACE